MEIPWPGKWPYQKGSISRAQQLVSAYYSLLRWLRLAGPVHCQVTGMGNKWASRAVGICFFTCNDDIAWPVKEKGKGMTEMWLWGSICWCWTLNVLLFKRCLQHFSFSFLPLCSLCSCYTLRKNQCIHPLFSIAYSKDAVPKTMTWNGMAIRQFLWGSSAFLLKPFWSGSSGN